MTTFTRRVGETATIASGVSMLAISIAEARTELSVHAALKKDRLAPFQAAIATEVNEGEISWFSDSVGFIVASSREIRETSSEQLRRLIDGIKRSFAAPNDVRGRPKISCLISIGCEPPDEELDDGDRGHRRAGFDQRLDVLGQPPVAAEPGEGALDHP